jgi:hypothetical protein
MTTTTTTTRTTRTTMMTMTNTTMTMMGNENYYAMTFRGDYGYKGGAESMILLAPSL